MSYSFPLFKECEVGRARVFDLTNAYDSKNAAGEKDVDSDDDDEDAATEVRSPSSTSDRPPPPPSSACYKLNSTLQAGSFGRWPNMPLTLAQRDAALYSLKLARAHNCYPVVRLHNSQFAVFVRDPFFEANGHTPFGWSIVSITHRVTGTAYTQYPFVNLPEFMVPSSLLSLLGVTTRKTIIDAHCTCGDFGRSSSTLGGSSIMGGARVCDCIRIVMLASAGAY